MPFISPRSKAKFLCANIYSVETIEIYGRRKKKSKIMFSKIIKYCFIVSCPSPRKPGNKQSTLKNIEIKREGLLFRSEI